MKSKSVSLKKLDVLFLALIALVCAVWFVHDFSEKGGSPVAIVYCGGEEVYSVRLDELDESEEKEFSGCVILFERDGASIVSATCKNRLCVKKGKLTRPGEAAACVPNKVVLELRGEENDADIIAY